MYTCYAWILECLCLFMLDCEDVKLTPSGRSVDRLPICMNE